MSESSVGVDKNAVRVELRYQRGLFQGDSLSSLLFCLCLAPLSHALRELKGYKCATAEVPITHQLFTDDLKVYSRGEKRLGEPLEVVDRTSAAIGMRLGLRKCAVTHMAKRRIRSANYFLSGDREVVSLNEGNVYKYLGVDKIFQPALSETKRRITQTYIKRLRKNMGSDLKVRHKVKATNVRAVSIFQYFIFLRWLRRDLDTPDRKTRSILRQHRSHQYTAAV